MDTGEPAAPGASGLPALNTAPAARRGSRLHPTSSEKVELVAGRPEGQSDCPNFTIIDLGRLEIDVNHLIGELDAEWWALSGPPSIARSRNPAPLPGFRTEPG